MKRTHSKIEDKFNPKWVKKLFIIVCIRFGLENVEKDHFESIKKVLKMKYCVGAIGGRKNKAHYFVGSENNNLVFLDPHYVNEAIKKDSCDDFDVSSYVCDNPMTLSMDNLDPGLGFGFLVNNEEEFNDLKQNIEKHKCEDPNLGGYL